MLSEDLLSFMQGHFGSQAQDLINAQMAVIGITDLGTVTDTQKINLAEGIMNNCFTGLVSGMKLRMVMAQLCSVLGVQMTQSGDDGMI